MFFLSPLLIKCSVLTRFLPSPLLPYLRLSHLCIYSLFVPSPPLLTCPRLSILFIFFLVPVSSRPLYSCPQLLPSSRPLPPLPLIRVLVCKFFSLPSHLFLSLPVPYIRPRPPPFISLPCLLSPSFLPDTPINYPLPPCPVSQPRANTVHTSPSLQQEWRSVAARSVWRGTGQVARALTLSCSSRPRSCSRCDG